MDLTRLYFPTPSAFNLSSLFGYYRAEKKNMEGVFLYTLNLRPQGTNFPFSAIRKHIENLFDPLRMHTQGREREPVLVGVLYICLEESSLNIHAL